MSDRQARLWSVAVVAYLALAYYIINYPLIGRFSPEVEIYVIRPLIWSGLGLISYLLLRRVSYRPLFDRTFTALAVLSGLFSIAVLICAGLLFGFGHSPYARDAVHMAQNFWYLAAFVCGLELSRSYLMTVWGRVNAPIAFTVVALIYAAVMFVPREFDSLMTSDQSSLRAFSGNFMPGISESIMATFLVSVGGPLPAIVYHLSLEAFRWLSPILPTLGWTAAAFIGTLTPAAAMLIVRDAYFNTQEAVADETGDIDRSDDTEDNDSKTKNGKFGVSPFLLFGVTLIVAMIWLNAGLFGVTPHLVSGPSMKPGLAPGDIVFTEDVDPNSIKVGDVIRYQGSQGDVIHRVIAIEWGPQEKQFITQGDNNNTIDAPVPFSRVKGKLVYDIPYVGWLPIKIRDLVQ
jgi:signal peptidase